MASHVGDIFSITIDDFRFTLISKSVPDFRSYLFSFDKTKGVNEERKKIMFQSQNLTTSIIEKHYAYTSVSELGMWRLCFLQPGRVENIYKFDNYIQATLLDIRFQIFINKNFDLLPFVSEIDATGTKNILSAKVKSLYPKESKDYDYIAGINPHGIIGCSPAQPNHQRDIENRFIPLFSPGLITLQQKSSFLEEKYNLIQDSYNKITEYDIQLDNFQAHVDIYEILAVRKEESLYEDTNNIVFQIGKFVLDVIPLQENIHREGYYIFNMKLPDAKINKYGLYDRYISGTCINPFRNSVSYYSEEDYITKPLNYIIQQRQVGVSQSAITGDVRENIKSKLYFFSAYKNEVQFPINQIIQFTASARASLPQSQVKSIGGHKRSKKSRKGKKSNKSRKDKKGRKGKKVKK